MNVVVDTRPATELSDEEVCVYLIKAIRAQDLRTAAAVRKEYKRIFPDMPADRIYPHLKCLGQILQ
jgi:hypothetical protein